MLSAHVYFQAFAAAIIWLLAFAVCGWGLRTITRVRRMPLLSFENIVTGICLCVPLFAMWATRGRTMLAPVPLLLIAALIMQRRQGGQVQKGGLGTKALVALGAGALALYFAFFSQAFWTLDNTYVKYPSGDLAYYCRLARHITAHGVENRLADLPARLQGMWQPYHWGDIWMIPLVAKLSGLREEVALLLVIYPLLSAVFVMGLASLYGNGWQRQRGWLLAVCLFAPFIASFTFFIPAPWKYEFRFFTAPVAQYPKLLLPGCLMLWVLHSVKRKEAPQAIWILFAAGLMFITILPAALIVAMCITVFLARKLALGIRILPAFCVPLITVGGWMLYLFQKRVGAVPYLPDTAIAYQAAAFHWRLLFTGILESSTMLPYVFVLIAFLYHIRKSTRWLFAHLSEPEIVLLGWLLAGLVSRAILHSTGADSFQFFENVRTIFLPIIVVWCAGLYFQSARGLWAAGALLLVIIISIGGNWCFSNEGYLTDKVATADYEAVQQMSGGGEPNRLYCVQLRSPNDRSGKGTRASTIYYPLEFLSLSDRSYRVASLSPIFMGDVDTAAINVQESLAMKWNSPLMQYVHEKGLEQALPDSAICSFVASYHPRLLIAASDAVIPECLGPVLTPDSIRLVSRKYRVFRLK